MKTRSVKIPVLNSLLFIRDSATEDLPKIDGLASVWSSTSCIAVSCLPDCDGETEVFLGPGTEMSTAGILLLDKKLQTPSRRVIVETVLHEAIFDQSVPSVETRIRIWTNGLRDTDKVIIGLG